MARDLLPGAEMQERLYPPARILVAEDDFDMRLVVVEVLEKEGYVVKQAASGRDVLSQLTLGEQRDCGFDLIVSDVRMPGMTSFQFLEVLRETGHDIPVILMSAFGDAEMRARARTLDAVLFEKPFVLEDLLASIAWLLGIRQRG